MKKYLVTAAATMLLLACFALNAQNSNARGKQKGSFNINGQWVLQLVRAADDSAGPAPWLMFDVARQRFTGYTGCNSFDGKLKIKGNRLSFNEQSVSTQNSCHGDKEDRFMAGLIKVNQFKITNGVLELMRNGTTLSKWVRKVPVNTGKKV